MPNWLRNQLIAAAVCLVIALVVHGFSCLNSSNEACLVSRGMLWVYWAVAYLFIGGPIAMASRGNPAARRENDGG